MVDLGRKRHERAGVGQRQVVQDRLEQGGLVTGVAVGQERTDGFRPQPLQQAVAQQRLTRAGLPGQQGEAFLVVEGLQELAQGHPRD